ncbi:MAG TPA: hypothetical protein VI546_00545 [candidate division Zixibacteria bacterium]|nr:hypothetical protein [candidate division Zixibacteria bacterium]
MNRNLWYPALGFLLTLATFACSNDSVSSDTDQGAILQLIGENQDFSSSDVLSSSNETLSKPAVDTVKFWWRQLVSRGRIIGWGVRQPADSIHPYPYLLVTLTDTLRGILHLVGADSTDSVHLQKPFTEVATRKLFFQKRDSSHSRHRGWVLAGVSPLELVSLPNTARIDSVKIQSATASQTVTAESVLAIILRPDIIEFAKGDSVTVTVYTGDATDSVYLHAHVQLGSLPSHRRKRLVNNGDGSFSGWFKVPTYAPFFGRWHLGVDVLKGHVLASDDLNGYDSRQWGLLYRVGVPD